MNLEEANDVLWQEIARLRELPYSELKLRVQNHFVQAMEIERPSGVRYQLEVQAFWDFQPEGNIRIIVDIDGGAVPATRPLTRGFIKAPDGTFIGE